MTGRFARFGRGAGLAALLAAAGCTESVTNKPDPLAENVIDEAGLGELLLNSGDPGEAVRYFEGALEVEPGRSDYRRGLAVSLTRAGRLPEAGRVYGELADLGEATPEDRLDQAMVLVKLGRWDEVERIDASLGNAPDTARRYVLKGLVADRRSDWSAADAAYGQAEKLSLAPAPVLNNWGVSHQVRGDLPGAELLFEQALTYDSRLFNAKNNLAITRAMQGIYSLPLVPMTDAEKAMMLNNMGMIALDRGQIGLARGLLAEAVETHPQYYQAAASRLAAIDAGQVN